MPGKGGASQLTGAILVALSGASFATATIAGKLAFRGGAATAAIVLFRLGLGAAVLWALVAIRRTPARVPAGRWPALVWMGVLSAAVGLLLFGAVERIPASTTTLILYVYPAVVAILSVVLGRDALTPGRLAALVLGLSGVALVLGFPVGGLDGAGAALALGAAIALALYILAAQTGAAGIPPLLAGALVLSIATVIHVPIGLAQGGLADVGESGGWALVVGAATGAGIALFLAGLRVIGPIKASIASTIEPVIAVALGAAALSERLSAWQAVGAILVVGAMALLPLTADAAAPGAGAGSRVASGGLASLRRPGSGRRGTPRRRA